MQKYRLRNHPILHIENITYIKPNNSPEEAYTNAYEEPAVGHLAVNSAYGRAVNKHVNPVNAMVTIIAGPIIYIYIYI